MPLRIATFNCENLFSRPKILDFHETPEQAQQADAALTAAQQLKTLLSRTTYTADNKKTILSLINQGKGFFSIEIDRGKLLQGNKVVASGGADFFGHIKFTAKDVSDDAQRNTGRVIKELNADVMCTVEVDSRELLGRFNSQVLTSKRFPHHMLVDGNDLRGIDVGMLSKLPIRRMRTHVDDMEGTTRIFSRDCMEYEVLLPNGTPLWVLCNHFKSKGFGSQAGNDARRKKQAARVAKILAENFNLSQELVVVAGDLNDTPDSDPLSPLIAVPNLHNVVDQLAPADRFTHIFGHEKNQLDYLLVSTPLKQALQSVTIERRGMFKFPGRFPFITKDAQEASDHAGVVAEFAV